MDDIAVCFECIHSCPTLALEINEEISCVRFEGKPAIKIDEKKCNNCNHCNIVCQMGKIALSEEGCSYCIICKSSPSCITPGSRNSFFDFFYLVARFSIVFVWVCARKVIKKCYTHNPRPNLLSLL